MFILWFLNTHKLFKKTRRLIKKLQFLNTSFFLNFLPELLTFHFNRPILHVDIAFMPYTTTLYTFTKLCCANKLRRWCRLLYAWSYKRRNILSFLGALWPTTWTYTICVAVSTSGTDGAGFFQTNLIAEAWSRQYMTKLQMSAMTDLIRIFCRRLACLDSSVTQLLSSRRSGGS